jgi:hypothetical protein
MVKAGAASTIDGQLVAAITGTAFIGGKPAVV